MPLLDIVHQDLYKLFENKSIAVVGNARSLYQSKFGRHIDNNDIVCRFNLGINHDSYKTHGSKTDWIVYNNENWAKSVDLFSLDTNANWMQVYQNPRDFSKSLPNPIYIMPSFILQKIQDYGNFSNDLRPSIGLVFLYFLTFVNPKQVNIYGFDWKKTHTFYNYTRKRKKDERKKGHDWAKEELFFTEKILKERNNFEYYINE